MKKSFLICAACLFLAAICIGLSIHVGADESEYKLHIYEINYENSTITFCSSLGDTVAYFSNSAKKTWEQIPGTFQKNNEGLNLLTFDISWISVSSNYTLTFKGDKSTNVGTVVLPKQATNLKVTYKANAEIPFAFLNVGSRTLEWRKSGTYEWETWDKETRNQDLGYLKGNGATLYFRLKAENGDSASAGKRPSKEVSVKIPSKKEAPDLKIDNTKLTLDLTGKMSYRVFEVKEDGSLGDMKEDWKIVDGTRAYGLWELVPNAMYSGTSQTETAPMAIQIKTNATVSAQESYTQTIIIPAQQKTPMDSSVAGITYTSSSTLELKVNAASEETPYEYCIVEKDFYDPLGLDYEEASWTEIKSGDKVMLNSEKAESGSHIYLRKKSVGVQGEEDYALATKEYDLTDCSSGVEYPSAMKAGDKIILQTSVGKINGGDKILTFTLKSSTKTTVSSIDFKEFYGGENYGNSYGRVSCTSTVAKDTKGDQYIITTKITSTSELDHKVQASFKDSKEPYLKLFAIITMENGEVIKSNEEAGVILYMYPASTVKTPDSNDKEDYIDSENNHNYYEEYRTAFERIYLSNLTKSEENTNEYDDTYFKFMVDFGTRYKLDSANPGTFTSDEVAIESITYDGLSLSCNPFTNYEEDSKVSQVERERQEAVSYQKNPSDAMIYYEDYTEDGRQGRRAFITIHADRFENKVSVKKLGESIPFVIKLNNGEEIKNAVTMKLVETATLDNGPISLTIIEQSLTSSKTNNTYDTSGNLISSVEEYVNSYSLTLTKQSGKYDVSVTDVTWGENGASVLYSASSSSGSKIEIVLSNAKINQLSPSAGQKSTTNNLVITLSNGFKISTGCKLTIISK